VVNHYYSNLNSGLFLSGNIGIAFESERQLSSRALSRVARILETILEKREAMNTSVNATIRKGVEGIETMPSIPTIFAPLLELLNLPPERVKLDESSEAGLLRQHHRRAVFAGG